MKLKTMENMGKNEKVEKKRIRQLSIIGKCFHAVAGGSQTPEMKIDVYFTKKLISLRI